MPLGEELENVWNYPLGSQTWRIAGIFALRHHHLKYADD